MPVSLMLMIVAGVLIGSLIGTILSRFVPFLMYRAGTARYPRLYRIDLGIIHFQLSFLIDLNLAGLIGLILAALLFKKL
jgi:hypothetical protein